jgi:hypothetical protein
MAGPIVDRYRHAIQLVAKGGGPLAKPIVGDGGGFLGEMYVPAGEWITGIACRPFTRGQTVIRAHMLAELLVRFPTNCPYVMDSRREGARREATDRWNRLMETEQGDCEDMFAFVARAFRDITQTPVSEMRERNALADSLCSGRPRR